jgi:pimeloyl-ACP methyl ester carboxylesterase
MTATLFQNSLQGEYWQWNNHSVYYVKAGQSQSNKPPLLLIHGFGASTAHWRKNIAQLQENYEVWAVDLLGFGKSAKPDIQYSGDLWRDQLDHFIQEVIGQPVVLAGNSLGGYASLCVASQRPNSAKGLILINSAGPFSDSQIQKPINPTKKIISNLTKKLFFNSITTFFMFQYLRRRSIIRKTLKKVYLDHSAVTDQLVEDIYLPSCDEGAVTVFKSVFSSPQGESVDILLKELSLPLLMLWGEGDPWMNAKVRGEKFRQYYPQLKEFYLKAGHCPHDEIPEEVNQIIDTWITESVIG